MQKYNNRNEVPEKYKWDLTTIFKDQEEYDKAFNTLKENIKKLNAYGTS